MQVMPSLACQTLLRLGVLTINPKPKMVMIPATHGSQA